MPIPIGARRPKYIILKRKYTCGAKFQKTYADLKEAEKTAHEFIRQALEHGGGTVLASLTIEFKHGSVPVETESE